MTRSPTSEAEVSQYCNVNPSLRADHVRRGWDAYREHLNNPHFCNSSVM